PASRRLVGRRARVERDHDRPAPDLAPLPRPAHARARPQDRERAARAAARQRHLGDLVRGAAGSLDDDRGLHRAEARWCRSLRPVRPAAIDLREIGARSGQTKPPPRPGPIRRVAFATAERWVRDRQEADGSWGGIQPPWVWSIIMLAALGYGFEDETLRAAVD